MVLEAQQQTAEEREEAAVAQSESLERRIRVAVVAESTMERAVREVRGSSPSPSTRP